MNENGGQPFQRTKFLNPSDRWLGLVSLVVGQSSRCRSGRLVPGLVVKLVLLLGFSVVDERNMWKGWF